jgi:hypothetical protein
MPPALSNSLKQLTLDSIILFKNIIELSISSWLYFYEILVSFFIQVELPISMFFTLKILHAISRCGIENKGTSGFSY